ncbi:cysteine protease, putative [Candida dubliniensis CD36]|uniref:Cysteine protease, putative n=1 Tax=Candida dubliniensis (strain CD36 / ATCC MYA-646 / CBS 7987 / NCPF 3949 / NRRL Y-17841) TaxID=573826 RepID=B9WH62_CANDC|nr:cysteine protease, putative [Candida dubliniensis CD36]CAX41503.1 cysteine protease, putative [Candida dubliniensis CD36]
MSEPEQQPLVTTREELIQRHKKESKDLIATITGLKKQATKKTRKSVLNKCQELQDNLDQKHRQELKEFDNPHGDQNEEDGEEITPEQLLAQLSLDKESSTIENSNSGSIGGGGDSDSSKPRKKRNRQRERLNRRQAEIDKIKQEAAVEASNTIDYRQIEIESMEKLLSLNNLQSFEIKPDGHCLFASIQDQLKVRHHEVDHSQHNGPENIPSIDQLRKLAGDYIKSNQDDFIPFLIDENTGELRDLDDYINELTTTATWGSDMEILALSKVFNCPISIYMAGASTLTINEHGQLPELKLGYYKHSFGLGEHYNSLRDL